MGKDGLGDSGYPPSRRKVADEHAVHALVRLANASPGELTLITIGPLISTSAQIPAKTSIRHQPLSFKLVRRLFSIY
jgi:purine nucleosidase